MPFPISVIDCVEFISESDYTSIYNLIDSFSPSELLAYTYENITVGRYAQRDLSLCLKTLSHSFATLDSNQLSLVKFSCFTSTLAILCLNNFLKVSLPTPFTKFPVDSSFSRDHLLVSDMYSWQLSLSSFAADISLSSSLLSAAQLTDRHLSISPVDAKKAVVYLYHSQQTGHEYSNPNSYFEYCRLHISKKILQGKSTQSFSPLATANSCQKQAILQYISQHSRVITYFTSSPDECWDTSFSYPLDEAQSGLVAQGVDLYKDEYLFITDLLSFCMSNNIGLIIRLHPRLAASISSSDYPSSALPKFLDVLAGCENTNFLVVQPNDSVSSYWLGALSDLNLFYRSTIGIELMLMGFAALSPNGRNSYSYQGHPFMHNKLPLTINKFFEYVLDTLNANTPSYSIYEACRSWYICEVATHFYLPNTPRWIPHEYAFRKIKGFIPALRFDSKPLYSRDIEIGFTQRFSKLDSFLASSTSLRPPFYHGRWLAHERKTAQETYVSWLQNYVYPAIEFTPNQNIDFF